MNGEKHSVYWMDPKLTGTKSLIIARFQQFLKIQVFATLRFLIFAIMFKRLSLSLFYLLLQAVPDTTPPLE